MNVVLLVFLYVLFGLLTCSLKAHKVINETQISCGNTQKMLNDCFEDLSPDLMEFLTTTKIPVTQKDINGKCIVFRQGMNCIDSYTKKCIESDRKKIFDSNVFGAKTFLNALCDNKRFQAEYLKHKDCFIFIQDDWQRCSTKFISILTDELHSGGTHATNVSKRFMQFCCSRYAYEKCIYNSAKFKCFKHSAVFVKAVVRMLSMERHFNNCGKFENLLCAAGLVPHKNFNVFLVILVILCTVVFPYKENVI